MMYCIYCGDQNPDNARFCMGCGEAFQQSSLPAAPAPASPVSPAPVTAFPVDAALRTVVSKVRGAFDSADEAYMHICQGSDTIGPMEIKTLLDAVLGLCPLLLYSSDSLSIATEEGAGQRGPSWDIQGQVGGHFLVIVWAFLGCSFSVFR